MRIVNSTFAEVVNNQSSKKNNRDESDSKHGEQNKDYASGDSVKHLKTPWKWVWEWFTDD
jgi:hypothetical protein